MAIIPDCCDDAEAREPSAMVPRRGRQFAPIALFATLLTVAACGSAPQTRRGDAAPPTRAGEGTGNVDDSDGSGTDADDGRAGADQEDAAGRLPPHPDGPEPMGPKSRAALQDWSDALRNAANRDRETELVIRGYLAMARDVFARFRGSQSGPGKQGEYDPEPSWRFHLSAAASLIDLSARAALLQEHFEATAAAQAIDLARPGAMGSRGERLQLYATLAACIREDTWVRAMHGTGLMRAFGAKPVALERNESNEMMRREVAMIRVTMKCTSLASRRRPPDPSGR